VSITVVVVTIIVDLTMLDDDENYDVDTFKASVIYESNPYGKESSLLENP
jgi:hypothetical protein